MSIACKCDRCGKLFEMAGSNGKCGFHIPAIKVQYRDIFRNWANDSKSYEFCYECFDELQNWLETKGDNNGREVRNTNAAKGAGRKRREARKTDAGDTPDSE